MPAVPIYIQEKIHPQAIDEDLRRQSSRPAECEEPLSLFNNFNGIEDFEQRVDFYHHEGHWTNRMILGDSLLVMNSLAEKEKLKGKVQMVYLDPPYGIKFGSNWQVSTRKRQVGDRLEDATRQPEQVRAFRDTWQLGIHSYLAYLRDRLLLARELLTETGSVFVQIGDENVHLVRCVLSSQSYLSRRFRCSGLCPGGALGRRPPSEAVHGIGTGNFEETAASRLDEVFGSDNYCSLITFQKTGGASSTLIATTVDYLLWYAKDKERVKFRPLFLQRNQGDTTLDRYDQILLPDGSTRRLTRGAATRRRAARRVRWRSPSGRSSGRSARTG